MQFRDRQLQISERKDIVGAQRLHFASKWKIIATKLFLETAQNEPKLRPGQKLRLALKRESCDPQHRDSLGVCSLSSLLDVSLISMQSTRFSAIVRVCMTVTVSVHAAAAVDYLKCSYKQKRLFACLPLFSHQYCVA